MNLGDQTLVEEVTAEVIEKKVPFVEKAITAYSRKAIDAKPVDEVAFSQV
jgi:hypothetical protein